MPHFVLSKISTPTYYKPTESFLELRSYFRRALKGLAQLCESIAYLLRNDNSAFWGVRIETTFLIFKMASDTSIHLLQSLLAIYLLNVILTQEAIDSVLKKAKNTLFPLLAVPSPEPHVIIRRLSENYSLLYGLSQSFGHTILGGLSPW